MPELTWPPAHLPASARLFAERGDDAHSALDRWVAGLWLSRPTLGPWKERDHRAFVAQVEAASQGLASLVPAELGVRARRACRRAFIGGEMADGAQALALVREAARRTLGLLAHPPQVMSAWCLVSGRMVELDTGEGKTLTAALAACVGALAGVPTHVVTVNDYLAQRDAQKMSPLFDFFGLSVGVIQGGVPQDQRAQQYAKDLSYCTNKDLVFDYLRDRVNTVGSHSLAQLAVRQLHGQVKATEPLRLRGLHFAIVDEADSILIDEARTPLILSAATQGGGDAHAYEQLLVLARTLVLDEHFRLPLPHRQPELTDAGRLHLEQWVADQSGQADFLRLSWVREHYVLQALRALHVFVRDQHYVVADGKVVIVDEFTGRLMPDRSWEQGLHQLVETKEGCALTGQNKTLARLTYQTFFARYLRLAGMSGTLSEVARETAGVFKVRTVRVEPNRPSQRTTLPAQLWPGQASKRQAVVAEVQARLADGQSVLVGTRSVWASEAISQALTQAGVVHQVLNARQNADEADLIGRAGLPGQVTVATNMAGRGTDIPVSPEVVAHGGLHVILTEWHESPRIDRQLFGRCARQGDPGSCRAIVALDDEVIARHGGLALKTIKARYGQSHWPPQAIAWLQKAVQGAAERHHAAQRAHTQQSDRQMREQLAFSGAME
jgi:preprotein translocase subunit SecA